VANSSTQELVLCIHGIISHVARSVLSEVMHFSSSSLIEVLLHFLETFASASLLRDAAVMSVM